MKQGLDDKEYSIDKTLNDIGKCEETMCELAHLKLIYECLEYLTTDNSTILSIELRQKLQRIITAHSIDKYYKLPSSTKDCDDKLTILGILNIPKPELNHEEKKIIKTKLEEELLKRINSFIATYEEYGGNLIEAMGTTESTARQELSKLDDSVVPHWKNKIDEMCNEYCRDLIICGDLLDEWQRLKHDDIEELDYKKAQTKLLQAEIAELQGKITKLQCAIKMFKETPITLDAFKTINNYLIEKNDNIQTEIKKKKLLLKEFNDLQGTEFDEILKRYTDLCITIEKDERLLNNLNN